MGDLFTDTNTKGSVFLLSEKNRVSITKHLVLCNSKVALLIFPGSCHLTGQLPRH